MSENSLFGILYLVSCFALDKVYPIREVVHIDYFLPGCPPSADEFLQILGSFRKIIQNLILYSSN
ncbi:MAG: hypothetical protein Q7T85_10555 [Nitrosomonas sp.]|nr:hypothetical protein [Nitrosomonas sp.]